MELGPFGSVGTGGKETLREGSDKVFALKVSYKLWSHSSGITHLGSRTSFPAW